MGIYLAPVWHSVLPEYRTEFGVIANLHPGSGVWKGVEAGAKWMLDNNVYSGKFNEDRWLALLTTWSDYKATCLGVVAPDVLRRVGDGVRGDWEATLRQFAHYAPVIRDAGFPIALVSQDGLTVEMTPWDDIDVLFVGGSDEHKLHEAWPLIVAGKRRNKWVHVGRVNSAKRILRFWMADSWDGTMLKTEPSVARQRYIINAARQAATMKQMETLI